MPWEELYRLLWKYKLLWKWKAATPIYGIDPKLAELLIRVCSPEEKDEFLREILDATIAITTTTDLESLNDNLDVLHRVLSGWTATCFLEEESKKSALHNFS